MKGNGKHFAYVWGDLINGYANLLVVGKEGPFETGTEESIIAEVRKLKSKGYKIFMGERPLYGENGRIEKTEKATLSSRFDLEI
ncbi:MAG: hypothetical protein JW716_00865 [Candidatus Aenigmarchaeota archaeon]|nr:hypothetical protein [Candidatus Aenigmarchaeota archaeon]